ncbi:hypothetical protein JWG45_15695 [Leptospira sp. 201903070]|uniref:Glycosyltransferase RgtA/B/C/D-like domain-containing protein n=1 Tax=Leptospira ainlahdjerensis TaxID=2810033 RepID=A0ABS2UDZ0_9LEPT|nr:hypothetical protein [Leptospira ainlahdjerensis]MBM9578590.1 hypothetical protein [Leptospira ainlahdjerensis]
MIGKFKKEIVLVTISFFVFLTSFNNQPQISDIVFNADILYPAVLYQDIVTDGSSFFGWSLTPSPYFFPDIAFFFLIKLFIEDGIVSLYLAFFIQALTLLAALLFFVSSGIESAEDKILASKITLIIYSIFLIYFSLDSYFFPVFGFVAHGGALVFCLLSAGLLFSENERGNKFWFLFGILQILLIASDPLYLFYFSFPCLYFLGSKWKKKKEPEDRNSFFLSLFIFGIGVYFYRSLTKSDLIFIPTGYYKREFTGDFFSPLWITLQNQIANNPYSFGALIVLYLSLWILIRFSKSKRNTEDPFQERSIFLVESVIISSLGILISGTVSGIFQKEGVAIRYLLPFLFFWIPLLIIALFRLSSFGPKRIHRGLEFLFLIVVVCSFYRGDLKPKMYQDSLTSCLDQNRKIHFLSRGLSNFWDSRRIRIFSRTDLRVDNYLEDLHPEYWQNSWNWFTKTPNEEYNFAVLPGLNKNKLKKEFGEPDRSIFCEKHEILIWNPDSKERFIQFRKKKTEEIELWHKLTGRKPL